MRNPTKKRAIISALSALVLFSACAVPAYYGTDVFCGFTACAAEDITYDGLKYKIYEENGTPLYAEVTGFEAEPTDELIIPETIEYYGETISVTSIGKLSFAECEELKAVEAPNATSICDHAFSNCVNLTAVEAPKAALIDDSAFYYCINLTTVDVSDVASIGNAAFADCEKLTTIDVSNAVSIDENAFADCFSLTAVEAPNAASIGNNAFGCCEKLTSVKMPNVISISDNAFIKCGSITSVELPNALSIGVYAFKECGSITSIELPNVRSINMSAFWGCNNLTSVKLPNAISLRDGVFSECVNLKSVEIPNVTSIGKIVFQNCVNITSIEIPKVTSISRGAFAKCTSLSEITMRSVPTNIEEEIFHDCNEITLKVPSENIDSWKEVFGENTYGAKSIILKDNGPLEIKKYSITHKTGMTKGFSVPESVSQSNFGYTISAKTDGAPALGIKDDSTGEYTGTFTYDSTSGACTTEIDFSEFTFTDVGEYWYEIKENTSTIKGYQESEPCYLHVIVKNNAPDDSETDEFAVTQVQLRKTMDTSGDKLTAMEGYYENGELEIKLKLSGDARALTDKFNITAVLTYPNELSAAPSDIYQLTKDLTTAPAIKLGEDKKTVTVTFEGVTADNTILLTGLPAGVTYKVTETPEKEYYINPVFSFESPDINNETLLDKALNKYAEGTISDNIDNLLITNTANMSNDVGVFLENKPFMAIFGSASAIAVGAFVYRRKRINEDDII